MKKKMIKKKLQGLMVTGFYACAAGINVNWQNRKDRRNEDLSTILAAGTAQLKRIRKGESEIGT